MLDKLNSSSSLSKAFFTGAVAAAIAPFAHGFNISDTTLREFLATQGTQTAPISFNSFGAGMRSYLIDNLNNPSGILDSIGIVLTPKVYITGMNDADFLLNPTYTTYNIGAWRFKPTTAEQALNPDILFTGLQARSVTNLNFDSGLGSQTIDVTIEASQLNFDLSQYQSITAYPISNENQALHSHVLSTNGSGAALEIDKRVRRTSNGTLAFVDINQMSGVNENTRFGTFRVTTAVPEPSSLLGMGIGAAGIVGALRRRKNI